MSKCHLITTENNQIVKIPGLFRTEFMFIGEAADVGLDAEGAFVRSCELFETGSFIFKNYMAKEEEKDFVIMIISCWNRQVDAVTAALDEFGRKMQWKYIRYKNFVENIFGEIFGDDD